MITLTMITLTVITLIIITSSWKHINHDHFNHDQINHDHINHDHIIHDHINHDHINHDYIYHDYNNNDYMNQDDINRYHIKIWELNLNIIFRPKSLKETAILREKFIDGSTVMPWEKKFRNYSATNSAKWILTVFSTYMTSLAKRASFMPVLTNTALRWLAFRKGSSKNAKETRVSLSLCRTLSKFVHFGPFLSDFVWLWRLCLTLSNFV